MCINCRLNGLICCKKSLLACQFFLKFRQRSHKFKIQVNIHFEGPTFAAIIDPPDPHPVSAGSDHYFLKRSPSVVSETFFQNVEKQNKLHVKIISLLNWDCGSGQVDHWWLRSYNNYHVFINAGMNLFAFRFRIIGRLGSLYRLKPSYAELLRLVADRGVEVNKRTVTTYSYSLL